MTKFVAIMGSDEHAYAVRAYLQARGQAVALFDTRGDWKVTGTIEDGLELVLSPTMRLDELSLSALYWRSHDGVSQTKYPHPEADRNRQSLLDSWLKGLAWSGVPMFNGYAAWQLHQTKPFQMQWIHDVLQGEPIRVPAGEYNDTSPEMLQVYKGAQGGWYGRPCGDKWAPETEYLAQQRIYGTTYRVYTFPQSVTSYRICANALDYRKDPQCKSIPEELPSDISQAMIGLQIALMAEFGWMWAGSDLMQDYLEDQWYLLDVNPSPMFLNFEEQGEVLGMLGSALLAAGDEESDIFSPKFELPRP